MTALNTTCHVYYVNIFKSSRVLIQSKWDNNNIYVHTIQGCVNASNSEKIHELDINFVNLINIIYKHKNINFVFHAQSSLPYLLLTLILKKIKFKSEIGITYDVHDLHEKISANSIIEEIRYNYLRYWILYIFEWITFRIKSINKITVSKGLSDLISQKYSTKCPNVVYSSGGVLYSARELNSNKRLENTLLYFGNINRLPIEIFDFLENNGIDIHLYGRNLDNQLESNEYSNIQYFGEYDPQDLTFLLRYKYLILYKDNIDTLNFRYSMPNKVFQALSHGLSVIMSRKFHEINETFKEVNGAVEVIDEVGEIKSAMQRVETLKNINSFKDINCILDDIYKNSKNAYLKSIRGGLH